MVKPQRAKKKRPIGEEEEADKKQQLADRIEKLKKKRADRLQEKMEHLPVT